MTREFLERLIQARKAEVKRLDEALGASEDIDEVRALGAILAEARGELRDIEDQLATLDDGPAPEPAVTESRSVNIGGVYGMNGFQAIERMTLGDHFVREVREAIPDFLAGRGGKIVAAPYEARAASDTHTVSPWSAPLTTVVDPSIVQEFRRPMVDSLFAQGALSGTSLTYFVEGPQEGAPGTVAEGAQKPQLHFANPTQVTESLKLIAGWINISKLMFPDLPFLVSEINGRLLYALGLVREQQLLNGDGTGENIRGLLNRSGLQTEAAASGADNADAIYRAISKVQELSGYSADGIIINPADYTRLRLSKDANGQYFGGGFFSGAYGSTGLAWEPPIWGVRTVVTPAVAAGTAVVGSFMQGATVYSNGGIVVTSTDSHEGNFTKNIVTTLAEERKLLAVRVPKAFCKVTLLSV